jgi:importin-5
VAHCCVCLWQAGARICKALGPEFLPYMEIVMPPLLQSAQLKPDVNITDAGSDEDEDYDNDDDEVRVLLGCMYCNCWLSSAAL